MNNDMQIAQNKTAIQSLRYTFPTLEETNHLMHFCNALAQSPFYQKLGAAGVLAIYMNAREMNLPVMFCMNGGMHNVEGKVVLSAQLMNLMLINAGWKIEFLEMNNTVCNLKFIFPNGKRFETFKYTIEDARKAGYFGVPGPNGTWAKKPKDNWIYHTLDMLFSRAMSSGARKFAPNVLYNCYGVGELDGDDHISPVTPDDLKMSAQAEIEAITEEEKPQNVIEDQAISEERLQEFIERNSIVEGSEIYEYVLHIAKIKKCEPSKSLEICCKNEETFLAAFQRLQDKKKKKEEN